MDASKDSSGFRFFVWLTLVALGLLLALATGRLEPKLVPDSASYLDFPFDSLDAALRSIRTPGYPIWLRAVESFGGIDRVPVCQVIIHATAVSLLVFELRRRSMPGLQLFVVAVCVAVGCTPADHVSVVSTDALAASMGVIATACLLRWSRLKADGVAAAMVVVVTVTAIMIRPAYLFLVPWSLVAGWMLLRMADVSRIKSTRRSLLLVTFISIPILGWMTLRQQVVGEFAMVPFGHQNLAGILVQLVSDEELNNVGGEAAELAVEIVAEKSRLADTGHRFAQGDPAATMTVDARWDEMTYFVVIPAAQRIVGDDRVAQHKEVAKLNRAIIRLWPQRYIVWLLKSVRRGAWAIAADMVMHPIFLIAILLAMAWVLFRSMNESAEPISIAPQSSLAALSIVAITYLLMKLGFVILTSPPIGRFADAAAILLPAWLAASFVKKLVDYGHHAKRPPSIRMT